MDGENKKKKSRRLALIYFFVGNGTELKEKRNGSFFSKRLLKVEENKHVIKDDLQNNNS